MEVRVNKQLARNGPSSKCQRLFFNSSLEPDQDRVPVASDGEFCPVSTDHCELERELWDPQDKLRDVCDVFRAVHDRHCLPRHQVRISGQESLREKGAHLEKTSFEDLGCGRFVFPNLFLFYTY